VKVQESWTGLKGLWEKVKIELKEGEVICSKCKGSGSWPATNVEIESPYWSRCPKCQGDGKLDWIHAITGKPPLNPYENLEVPLLRRIYPKLIAKQLISVEPLSEPELVNIFIHGGRNG
jgi:hypothetical protein